MATNIIGTADGRDFSTITAWEAAVQGTLTEIENGDAKDDSDFNEQVIVNGSTATINFFIRLTADTRNRHKGIVGEGCKMDNLTPANDAIFEMRDAFTQIEWFLMTGSGSSANPEAMFIFGGGAVSNRITDSIIYELPANGAGNADGFKSIGGSSGTQFLRNLIIYAMGRRGIEATNGQIDINCANNTVYGCGDIGFACESGDIIADNNISFNNTGSDYAEAGAGNFLSSDNNMSSDDTADDFFTNFIINASGSAQFVSVEPGNEDFHLNPTASAKGFAVPQVDPLNDIDGQQRRRWDLGADEERIEVRNYVLNLF